MRPDEYCDHIEEFLDDVLSREDRREMERHVSICSECRTAVEEYRRLRRLALAAGPVTIPDDLGFRIRQRLDRATRPQRPRSRIFYPVAFAGAAAAAVLLLVATFFITDDTVPPPDYPAVVDAIVTEAPLDEALADWLVMATNAGVEDAMRLAGEAREHRLLDRVRDALVSARGEDYRYLTAVSDLLVQLENGPGLLAEEARLVAKVRQP